MKTIYTKSIIPILKKVYIKGLNYFKINIIIHFKKNLWLSLGENCLADRVLDRHGLKSFSTPYSHGRSNIDYALSLEKINYNDWLNKKNLTYEYIDNERVVRSTLINQCDRIFFEPHMKNFEFTHHDVIQDEKAKNNLKRKTQRLLKFRGKKDITFLYHHRINDKTDFNLLFKKAIEFSQIYSVNKHFCNLIIFAQKIITNKSDRKVCYQNINSNVHFFEFHTEQIWTGPDLDVFWARIDDDLIEIMLKYSIKIITNNQKYTNGPIF